MELQAKRTVIFVFLLINFYQIKVSLSHNKLFKLSLKIVYFLGLIVTKDGWTCSGFTVMQKCSLTCMLQCTYIDFSSFSVYSFRTWVFNGPIFWFVFLSWLAVKQSGWDRRRGVSEKQSQWLSVVAESELLLS